MSQAHQQPSADGEKSAAGLTDKLVRELTAPASGNRIHWHGKLPGFGLRITAAGAKAFVFRYRNADCRDRTLTIGSPPSWTVAKAIEQAKALRRRVDNGKDPLAERQDQRNAPTVNELCERFAKEHLPRLRASSAREYQSIIDHIIRPQLGKTKVAALRHVDVEKMHRTKGEEAPYRANRAVAVLSKMLSFAVKWEYRSDNPARGIERHAEHKREKFLTPAEIARLGKALAAHGEKGSANAIRLLLLTGARRGEVLSAEWSQFDLIAGVWSKPYTGTKQKRDHRVPLSAPALALLAEMLAEAKGSRFLFPSTNGRSLVEIKKSWRAVCVAAGIDGVRIHDLRHTYASVLASSGLSLPIIGALLGHTQAATTQRYAHLLDDPLRAATEQAGAIIAGAGKPSVDVMRPQRRS
jgi:integrase